MMSCVHQQAPNKQAYTAVTTQTMQQKTILTGGREIVCHFLSSERGKKRKKTSLITHEEHPDYTKTTSGHRLENGDMTPSTKYALTLLCARSSFRRRAPSKTIVRAPPICAYVPYRTACNTPFHAHALLLASSQEDSGSTPSDTFHKQTQKIINKNPTCFKNSFLASPPPPQAPYHATVKSS